MPNAEVLTPGGIQELTAALQRATPSSRLLAGGTDLIRSMHQEHWEPDLLIDLSGVRELDFVRLEAGTLRIGSMTTFAELQADPLVRRHARCLAEAAAQVGSAQLRNVATVGGNIANASPCADSVAALGADQRTTFAKSGSRSAVTVARLSMALVVKYGAGAGTVSEASIPE